MKDLIDRASTKNCFGIVVLNSYMWLDVDERNTVVNGMLGQQRLGILKCFRLEDTQKCMHAQGQIQL